VRKWTVATSSPEETRELGRLLGRIIDAPTAILLSGELGAGKTCLIQGLATGLGVAAGQAVTSPSYTLMNFYRGRLDLYHFDLYRLSDPDELVDIDFDEYIYGSGVTVVEWADRFPGLEAEGLQVEISYEEGEGRRVLFRARGKHGEGLLAHLARRWREKGECI
jgi:tRNA threonylcarbamoyladenosine biosynthesis protein TsaE